MVHFGNEGMMLPGYDYSARYSGFSPDFDALSAILVGASKHRYLGNRTDFALYAANKGWLVQQPYLNQQYTESFTENLM